MREQYDPLFKEKVVKEYLDDNCTIGFLMQKYELKSTTVRDWIYKYKALGITAFVSNKRVYSPDLKKKAVESYLNGEGSLKEICIKFDISDSRVLRAWIMRYNANMKLNGHYPGGDVSMPGRNVTYEERKRIVEYCLNHEKDYKGTSIAFEVSYYQVYYWVKRYEEDGEKGLSDNRGRHKNEEELDEVELLRKENRRLKNQLEESEKLVELLKKVKELERK